MTRGLEDVFRRLDLLRIDWVSVSCFSRSRPLCVSRGETGVPSDEEVSRW